MDGQIHLDQDWHVKSTFSSGTATVAENVQAAEERGLRSICVVDKVRPLTGWVREFTGACAAVDRETLVDVNSGVEVEVLDTSGTLDAPSSIGLADFLFVSARRLPTPNGPMEPAEAREKIEAGALLPAKAIEWLVRASAAAAQRHDGAILARPFSILPQLGLGERNLHPPFVRCLAAGLAGRDAGVELSERWRSPSPWVVACFMAAGVVVRPCTESYSPQAVGRYEWCRGVANQLAGNASHALAG